jgi:hypothetical protein
VEAMGAVPGLQRPGQVRKSRSQAHPEMSANGLGRARWRRIPWRLV